MTDARSFSSQSYGASMSHDGLYSMLYDLAVERLDPIRNDGLRKKPPLAYNLAARWIE